MTRKPPPPVNGSAIELEKLHSKIVTIPLENMRVSANAQRTLRPARVMELLEMPFDLELLGYPVLNLRESAYWIIDGQHRIEALKRFLVPTPWQTQAIECRVYTGQTESWEADMFDRLNNNLHVNAFDTFKIRVTAKRVIECDVKRVVENVGLRVGRDHGPGSVSAVSTLVKVAKRGKPATLGRSLNIVHRSFGDVGLTNHLIDGVARVCDRYDGQIKDVDAIARLNTLRGGVSAVMGKAEVLRQQTRRAVPECVAAAVVDILNSKRGGNKLRSWWAADVEA